MHKDSDNTLATAADLSTLLGEALPTIDPEHQAIVSLTMAWEGLGRSALMDAASLGRWW